MYINKPGSDGHLVNEFSQDTLRAFRCSVGIFTFTHLQQQTQNTRAELDENKGVYVPKCLPRKSDLPVKANAGSPPPLVVPEPNSVVVPLE